MLRDPRHSNRIQESRVPAGGQPGTALGTVVSVWLERQIELRGFYNINLTSTALALALASRHPALAEVQAWLLPRALNSPLVAETGTWQSFHADCHEPSTHHLLITAEPKQRLLQHTGWHHVYICHLRRGFLAHYGGGALEMRCRRSVQQRVWRRVLLRSTGEGKAAGHRFRHQDALQGCHAARAVRGRPGACADICAAGRHAD